MLDRLRQNKYFRNFRAISKGREPFYLRYPVDFRPRWTDARGNEHLDRIIAAGAGAYADNLRQVAALEPAVAALTGAGAPVDWTNGYIPALDALSLMWAATRADKLFMEIGSGNSTRFVRESLRYHNKAARLVSIDPHPRAEIDALCDEVVRKPLEDLDLAEFDRLEPGDVLFVDNSHTSMMNSDVTVFMLDVLPRLRPGVLVGVHDIMLPWDYPANWAGRGYNEQYLFACILLANPDYFDIQLPNYWIGREGLDRAPLAGIYGLLGPEIAARPSSAFWAVKR